MLSEGNTPVEAYDIDYDFNQRYRLTGDTDDEFYLTLGKGAYYFIYETLDATSLIEWDDGGYLGMDVYADDGTGTYEEEADGFMVYETDTRGHILGSFYFDEEITRVRVSHEDESVASFEIDLIKIKAENHPMNGNWRDIAITANNFGDVAEICDGQVPWIFNDAIDETAFSVRVVEPDLFISRPGDLAGWFSDPALVVSGNTLTVNEEYNGSTNVASIVLDGGVLSGSGHYEYMHHFDDENGEVLTPCFTEYTVKGTVQ